MRWPGRFGPSTAPRPPFGGRTSVRRIGTMNLATPIEGAVAVSSQQSVPVGPRFRPDDERVSAPVPLDSVEADVGIPGIQRWALILTPEAKRRRGPPDVVDPFRFDRQHLAGVADVHRTGELPRVVAVP